MGNIGWTGIIIIAILIVILFGKGKISSIMGDLAKGIKSFKKGMSDDNPSENNNTDNEDIKESLKQLREIIEYNIPDINYIKSINNYKELVVLKNEEYFFPEIEYFRVFEKSY